MQTEIIFGLIAALVAVLVIVRLVAIKQYNKEIVKDYIAAQERVNSIRKEAAQNKVPVSTTTQRSSSKDYSAPRITRSDISESTRKVDNSDFLISMAVANATDSALLGMAVGGDPVGAIIGDSLNDNDSNHSHTDHSSSDYSSSDSSSDYSSSDYSSSDSSSDYSSSDSSSSSDY
jgi:hypothetical protein